MVMMTDLIFFLTYSDVTVYNAIDVFEETKNTGVKYFGFKDVGLPKEKLKDLHSRMKREGKTTFLEVVTATKEDNVRSAKMAVELGVDYMIGGTAVKQTLPLLKGTNIKYFPYIGKIVGHPCLLRGTIPEIAKGAKTVEKAGAEGIDLLAYRYNGDVEKMIRSVQKATEIPLIVAGSIDSVERVKKMLDLNVWAFTIGSAFFDRKFVPTGNLTDQINAVLHLLQH
jgi:phosphoribosylformimino-5-aminoimidazole carboxamide ribonucleotide (ProFAR) isomerase